MTNKQLITTLAVSTLVLAQAGLVSADEITPTDPSQPATEVVTPTEPVPPVETPDEQPSQPTEPTSPVDEVTPTDPSQPTTEPTQPTTGDEATPSEPETKPELTDKDTTPAVETPKEEPKTPTTPTEEVKAPQEGDVSKATGQVVSVVTPEAPIETNTGVSIVSTKEGKLVLSDGSKVSPETVGAKTNDDKTITITKADGTKTTLPHTGEAQTLGLSLLGLAIAGLGLAFWKQKKSN